MNLVMFDIDGTLTQTFSVDSDCYVKAVVEVTGLEQTAINTDWTAYRHATDSGILDEIFRSQWGRSPQVSDINSVHDRFLQLLTEAASISSCAFAPLPGAQDLIDGLLESGYAVSLATGGWKASARLKLAVARLKVDALPLASADDALSRPEIMKCSYRRACQAWELTRFSSVTYVGDGPWDAQASSSLEYNFIGIGPKDKAPLLKELGAIEVFVDYSDPKSFRFVLDRITDGSACPSTKAGEPQALP